MHHFTVVPVTSICYSCNYSHWSMLEESSKLYVSDPYEFPLCALRICSVSHSNPEGLRTHPDVCFCLPNSLPGSHQPQQVSSAASPDLCVLHMGHPSLSCRGPLEKVLLVYSAACLFSLERFLVLEHPVYFRQKFLPVHPDPFLGGGWEFLFASLCFQDGSGRSTLQSPNSFNSSPMQQFIWLFFLMKISGSVSLEVETMPLSGATCDMNHFVMVWYKTLYGPLLGGLLVFLLVNCLCNLCQISVLRDTFHYLINMYVCYLYVTYYWFLAET